MKKIVASLFIILGLVGLALAEPSMQRERGAFNQSIQGFAPDGTAAALLTVASVTYDMTNYLAFSVYAPSDYKLRFMTSTSKAGSISETQPGGSWATFVVNTKTPFVNISGATSGMIRRQ